MRNSEVVRIDKDVLRDAKKLAGKSHGALKEYVTDAVAKMNSRQNPDSARVQVNKILSEMDKIDRVANRMDRCLKVFNFFGTYADRNLEKVLDNMERAKASKSAKDLAVKIFELNKRSAKKMEKKLSDLADAMEELELELEADETEYNAEYDEQEGGYVCLYDETEDEGKDCDLIYDQDEIVEHLRQVHGIPKRNQRILEPDGGDSD